MKNTKCSMVVPSGEGGRAMGSETATSRISVLPRMLYFCKNEEKKIWRKILLKLNHEDTECKLSFPKHFCMFGVFHSL